MMENRTGVATLLMSTLVLAALAWVAAGFAFWVVEAVRQDYLHLGMTGLLLWSAVAVYRGLLPPVLLGWALFSVLLLLVRRIPERRRLLAFFSLLSAAALAALLRFAHHLNRYAFVGFWKDVRNEGGLPGWRPTGEVAAGNAGLVLLILLIALVLAKVGRPLIGAGGVRPRRFLSPKAGAAALLLPAALFAAHRAHLSFPPDAPNILVIALDTVRQDHLTFCGYPRETSPSMSRLSREGVLFENTISQAPWTLSSFASLLTGLYPSSHGAFIGTEHRHLRRDHVPWLPKRVPTLAEIFKNSGYRTLCEATNTYLRFGLEQGYDHCRVELRPAEEVTDAFIDGMEPIAHRPFFAFLHYNDAHLPNAPPPPFDQVFPAGDRRPHTNEEKWEMLFTSGEDLSSEAFHSFREHKVAVYDGCIRYIDHQIGRVLAWLVEKGIARRTYVIALTDHGEEFWEHAEIERESYVDPRGFYGVGHGHTLFDEQLRLLLLLTGPGIPRSRIVSSAVRGIDLAPTLLQLAQIDPPAPVEGSSLLPLALGEESGDRPALSEAIIFGSDRRSLVKEGYKYVHSPDEPDLLFHLPSDPGETVNRIEIDRERAAELRAELEAWREARSGRGARTRGDLDEKTLEELRALGYID